eukprot:CAMPEP_0202914298 /NCGR_PEP_ID=MMETSP1392-20130828/62740_1 /ASSEMBLY_ACC=CAM_ASM_000868 /TAXON_ID=225041 /ORGANISM="Chlamydomonas chlamydogama, Strain SAG 11-48b" /LENGTH=503 /DNA_ID=CAMNT_0049605899 /DNA_START=304 /DNA_END=1814 /DNA_ORIENTATION=-
MAEASTRQSAVQREACSPVLSSWNDVENLWDAKWFGCSPRYVQAGMGSMSGSGRASEAASLSSMGSHQQRQQGLGTDGSRPGTSTSSSPVYLNGHSPRNPSSYRYIHEPGHVGNGRNGMPAQPAATPPAQQTAVKPVVNMTQDQAQSSGKAPCLGTWAARQFRLMDASHESPAVQERSGAAAPAPGNAAPAQAKDVQPNGKGADHDIDGDAAQDAAWRWRFARRWHAEQTRPIDPQNASVGDTMEEALQFLTAGGGTGWNMQLNANNRTTSTDIGSYMNSVGTLGAGSMSFGMDMLLNEDGSQRTGGPMALEATREVASLNRRAAQLVMKQAELEQQAEARWKESFTSNNDRWVGNLLETVQIDEWGSFRFLVVKVVGREGKQRILIRGQNCCTEAAIMETLNRKMMQVAALHGMLPELLQVMGGGICEWRRDRDRHLHMHSPFVSDTHAAGQAAGAAEPGVSAHQAEHAGVVQGDHGMSAAGSYNLHGLMEWPENEGRLGAS